MQFMVKAYDGEGMRERRMQVRPRHLEGMKVLGKQIICAGGLLDDTGKMKGSVLVLEFDSRFCGSPAGDYRRGIKTADEN